MKQKDPEKRLMVALRVYLVVAFVVAVVSALVSEYVFHRGRYEHKPLRLVLFLCSVAGIAGIIIVHRRNVKNYEKQKDDAE